MSATITTTRGYTFGATELVTNTKLHTLIDSATSTISGIVGSELASGASVVDFSLAAISTAGKVSGSALTSLANIPADAGVIPAANLASTSVTDTFDNDDLSSGDLEITHNLGTKAVRVTILDNNDQEIIPDSVTSTSTSVSTVALDSYGAISGTWTYKVWQ